MLDPDHEATIRFGSKAPRRRAHSPCGIGANRPSGSPPPRIIDGQSGKSEWTPNCLFRFPRRPAQAGCRNAKPAGISPTVTMRQNAMSSLRASATIIFVFRAAAGPSVRARYHWASALSFWNRRKRQASWIKPRLTRALPDFANPLSRRREPLSFGEPVRPAKRATARRSRRLRDSTS